MPPQSLAQSITAVGLMPEPGMQVPLSQPYTPAHLKGMVIDVRNPFKYDFIIHRGQVVLSQERKTAEYTKLIKYFLTALAIPDTDQWVNLSPYEQTRMIPDNFGLTEMGRDFLAQDYLLKQISATLANPDTELGKNFWHGVYARAYEKFGTTDVPSVDVISKVWVMPDHATIYEKNDTVYVLDMHLKVMSDRDYLAMKENGITEEDGLSAISNAMIREVIVPAVEKEVNEGKSFAPVRQVYSSMILATWYKRALKESVLNKIYGDRSRVKGVMQDDPADNVKIWERYVQAFHQGVLNMVREDMDQNSHKILPHKYFSGGMRNTSEIFNKPANIERVQSLSGEDSSKLDRAAVTLAPENVLLQSESVGVFHYNHRKTQHSSEFSWLLFDAAIRKFLAGAKVNVSHLPLNAVVLNQDGAIEKRKKEEKTLRALESVAVERGVEWVEMLAEMIGEMKSASLEQIKDPGRGFILKESLGSQAFRSDKEVDRIWTLLKSSKHVSEIAPGLVRLNVDPNRLVPLIESAVKQIANETSSQAARTWKSDVYLMLGFPVKGVSALERKKRKRVVEVFERQQYYYVASSELNDRGYQELYDKLVRRMQGIETSGGEMHSRLAKEQFKLFNAVDELNNKMQTSSYQMFRRNVKRNATAIAYHELMDFLHYKVMPWFEFYAGSSEDARELKGNLQRAGFLMIKEENKRNSADLCVLQLEYNRNAIVQEVANVLDARLLKEFNERRGVAQVALPEGVSDSAAVNHRLQDLNNGGIDFGEANLNMMIKRDGSGVPLPVSEQNFENIQIDGLIPQILSISPAGDMPIFQGVRIK
ncbi:MAG: hypothetical protein V2A70_05650 [Candidatus Omnitrophota bacterium]